MDKFVQGRRKFRSLSASEFLLSDRDADIMIFLWRWKLATTATIHEEIGKPKAPYSTYKALEHLSDHGYIEFKIDHLDKFKVWQLTSKGFETIRSRLGDLKEEGYLSENPNHDRHVIAFQLGEWAGKKFPQVAHFTEQQLRRLPQAYYPEWVPKVGNHRSDGYTRIQGEGGITHLSYEVELWPKSLSIYETVIRYYRMYRAIDRVYWLIGNRDVLPQILKAKTIARDPDDNYHLFVDVADYIRLGWDAPVRNSRSETLFTMRDDLRGILGESLGHLLGTVGEQFRYPVQYNNIKTLGRSKT